MEILTPGDLASLRQVSLQGARAAELALRQMTGLQANLDVSRVQPVAFPDVPSLLGGPEAPVVGIHLKVYGDCRGNVLLALSPETALKLVAGLFPPEAASLEQMEEIQYSGLMELGNIVTCSYLNALSVALRMSMIPSVPMLANDMAGAVVDVLLIEQGQRSDAALVILTEIRSQLGLSGNLLMMPDPASLPRVVEALRTPSFP